MSTPRFLDVLNQLGAAIVNALSSASIATPTQVYVGIPVGVELVKELNSEQYAVSILERRGTQRSTARYPANKLFTITDPVAALNATVIPPAALGDAWTIEFSGMASGGATVSAVVGAPTQVAIYEVAANASLASIATGVAAAINALAIAGITATPSGANVAITGTPFCTVNVYGVGYVTAREVNRLTRSIQVTAWTADPVTLRWAIIDAIESGVGTVQAPLLTLSDGTKAYCVLAGGASSGLDDEAQSSYSLFATSFVFVVEYGVLQTFPSYPILTVEQTLAVGANPAQTVIMP